MAIELDHSRAEARALLAELGFVRRASAAVAHARKVAPAADQADEPEEEQGPERAPHERADASTPPEEASTPPRAPTVKAVLAAAADAAARGAGDAVPRGHSAASAGEDKAAPSAAAPSPGAQHSKRAPEDRSEILAELVSELDMVCGPLRLWVCASDLASRSQTLSQLQHRLPPGRRRVEPPLPAPSAAERAAAAQLLPRASEAALKREGWLPADAFMLQHGLAPRPRGHATA